MKLKPYPQYKRSKDFGVVPSHWKIKRIKNLFNVFNGSTPNPNEENWEGNIVWTTPDDLGKLEGAYIIDSSRRITSKGYQSCGTNLVPKGSIIISSRAPIGHMGIASVDLCTNQGCKSLVPIIEFNNEYFYYLLESNKSNLQSLGQGATFTELSSSNLKSMAIIEPVLEEQNQIAEFLDKKISEIDLTIEKDTRLIELLKEKRTALINHVVTKGLDPTVKMKDSGVEWIGEIPEEWNINRLKFLTATKAQYGANEEPEFNENKFDYRYVRITDVNNNGGLKKDSLAYLSRENARGFVLDEGDVLFARSGATVGKVYYYSSNDGNCCFAGYMIRYVANDELLEPRFLLYYSLSKSYKEWIKIVSTQSTIENVSAEKYDELDIPTPKISQQRQIVKFLDYEIPQIDEIILKIEEKISLLEEYKKSLIHHVVTGKVDVREVAV